MSKSNEKEASNTILTQIHDAIVRFEEKPIVEQG